MRLGHRQDVEPRLAGRAIPGLQERPAARDRSVGRQSYRLRTGPLASFNLVALVLKTNRRLVSLPFLPINCFEEPPMPSGSRSSESARPRRKRGCAGSITSHYVRQKSPMRVFLYLFAIIGGTDDAYICCVGIDQYPLAIHPLWRD